MGTREAFTLALVLILSTSLKVSANDIGWYWEGEEDLSNEFLEVNEEPSTLERVKRGFFDNWWQSSNDEDSATDSPDDLRASNVGDDSDGFGSGAADKTSSEPREKTLRVTFKIQEPYREGYSDRDSSEFLELSHSLANAVDELYESLPGTQKSSLVRIQSLVNDQFACKVALDIVTTGYDNTDIIKDILHDHIRNSRRLGKTTVLLEDFSAQIIDPALVTDPGTQDQEESDKTVDNDVGQTLDSPTGEETNQNNASPDENLGNGYPDEDRNSQPDNQNPDDNNGYGNNVDPYDQSQDNTFPDQSATDGETNPTENQNRGDDISPWPSTGDLGEDNDEPDVLTTTEDTWRNEADTTTPDYGTTEASVCPSHYLSCDETRCVEWNKRCDGYNDCFDGTDEAGCADSKY